jgi:hypothetical protein
LTQRWAYYIIKTKRTMFSRRNPWTCLVFTSASPRRLACRFVSCSRTDLSHRDSIVSSQRDGEETSEVSSICNIVRLLKLLFATLFLNLGPKPRRSERSPKTLSGRLGLWDFAWRMLVLRRIWAFDRTNTQMRGCRWLKFVITTRNPKEPVD